MRVYNSKQKFHSSKESYCGILYCKDTKGLSGKLTSYCGKNLLQSVPSITETEIFKSRYFLSGETGTLFQLICLGEEKTLNAEKIRRGIYSLVTSANEQKQEKAGVFLFCNYVYPLFIQAVAESCWLSNYQYLKYRSRPVQNSLREVEIFIENTNLKRQEVEKRLLAGNITGKSACLARDLINEPVLDLNAVEFGNRIRKIGKEYGFSVQVLEKKKIEELKMGGLLAVNAGSEIPPTFSILEWKPSRHKNKRPVVLVGKGVVFDTGGLSLKPTHNSMDHMKSDMGGAAAVIGAFCSIAEMKLPLHVIGLIPSTDNRPGGNAYTPGDVIRMHSGKTVEVLNTDAEGRMILADALSFARQYNPELVIDLATLTGAMTVILGTQGIGMMSNARETVKRKMCESGLNVHERILELPLWDEYTEHIKSDIADIKNTGKEREAGTIIGGKFLQEFVDYPWIHLDIASTSFLLTADNYRGKGATGVGVRLLSDFLMRY